MTEFYQLTPIEFDHSLNDWGEQLKQQTTFEKQLKYEVARWQVKHLWNMQGRTLKRMMKKVTDVEGFEWDVKVEQNQSEVIRGLKTFFGALAKKQKR